MDQDNDQGENGSHTLPLSPATVQPYGGGFSLSGRIAFTEPVTDGNACSWQSERVERQQFIGETGR